MSTVKPVKVALIGSGNISYTYLNTLVKGGFNIIDVVGCSDLIPERSKARAELFGIRQMTNEEILNDPEIEIVINTTQEPHGRHAPDPRGRQERLFRKGHGRHARGREGEL